MASSDVIQSSGFGGLRVFRTPFRRDMYNRGTARMRSFRVVYSWIPQMLAPFFLSFLSTLEERYTGLTNIEYTAVGLCFQSLVYGIYVVLMPFSSHVLLKRGLRSRSNMFTFGMTLFMFALSTAYWAASIANLVVKIKSIDVDPSDRSTTDIVTYHLLFNAIILINYVITDGVVVWRAWILCPDAPRAILLIPTISLILTFMSVFGTIGIRTAITISQTRGIAVPNSSPLIHALNISQVANLVMTLITNVLATSIISYKAWLHRRDIKHAFRIFKTKSSTVERVLALLVESGFLYSISVITVLVCTFIRLPEGTLGDLYTPVNVHIAGIYPTIILVLVGVKRTMNETTFHTAIVQPSRSIPLDLEFVRNPAISGGATVDSRMLSSRRISILHGPMSTVNDESEELSSSELPELVESKNSKGEDSPSAEDTDDSQSRKGEAI